MPHDPLTPEQQALVTGDDWLAVHWARQYRGRGLAWLDLVQVARVGLCEAARRYQADRGPFSPFASLRVRGSVSRAVQAAARERRSDPRGPREIGHDDGRRAGGFSDPDLREALDRLPAVDRHILELRSGLRDGREWPVSEIAFKLKLSPNTVRNKIDAAKERLRAELDP